MNINTNNYEAFFLDYHEGNLSPQEVAELLLFVEQHPELKEEFESFENITLYDLNPISFEDKSGLKKEISEENRETWFIRAIEKDLDEKETKLLTDFLSEYPEYRAELDLFRKTILSAETNVVFGNKQALRKTAITTGTDELLISSIEGLLSKEENAMLMQQLSVDAGLKNEYNLYSKTKAEADLSIVFENKEELKRDRKVVPIFWYVSGIAAAILILFGLFFLFRTTGKPAGSQIANTNHVVQPAPEIKNQELITPKNEVAVNSNANLPDHRSPVAKKFKAPAVNEQEKQDNQVANNQQPLTNNQAENNPAPGNEQRPVVANNDPKSETGNQQPIANNEPAVAINQQRTTSNDSGEFLTLKEFAAEKIKEKTLDENSVAQQKQTGRLKRFSGWDVVQIITRGASKLTGHNLEVKPKYNDEGEVTAYALGNAFEVERGK